jgi:hypothetical protein
MKLIVNGVVGQVFDHDANKNKNIKVIDLPPNSFWISHLVYPGKEECLRDDVREWCDHSFGHGKWQYSFVKAEVSTNHIGNLMVPIFYINCRVITLNDYEDSTLFKLKWM